MSHSAKRTISTLAIVIASVAFGVLVSADLGLMPITNAQTQTTPIQTAQGAVPAVTIPSFADVAARAMPAVVSIQTTEIVRGAATRRRFGIDPFDFFFPPDPRDPRRRGQPEDDERRQQSGGSGFIISSDGYILTNNHVIENASKVEVSYGANEEGFGGRIVEATIVGRDPATDLALLKIDAQNLPTIPLGDSDRTRRGDWAIAIGSPFQLDNTLTVGVISAKGRALGMSEQTSSFENFIQTDAAINFGNSGGPLLNIRGEAIGINTAIRGMAQGLGFATPINIARQLLPQLRQGKVVRSYLGMEIREVTEDIREAWNLPQGTTGALVNSVTPGRPADRAGLQHGDIVVEIDGRPIRTNRELIDYISYLPVGTDVRVTFIRNGQRRTVTARTAERPLTSAEAEAEESATNEPVRNRLGMAVEELTPQMRQMYGHEDNIRGVIVTSVRNVSAAGEANIREGDVITEVQGQRVTTVEQFRRIIDSARTGQKMRMYVTTPATRAGGTTPFTRYTILTVP